MILASQSPRRSELLKLAGYSFCIVPADIDERPREGESPVELVERLAQAKARWVLGEASPSEVIIGADTLVWFDGHCLGKPRDQKNACEMLKELSGKTHQVTTGVCLLERDRFGHEQEIVFSETTAVTFFELSNAQIEAYVRSGEPMDKAGAYAIQGGGRLFVKAINGNYENVIGLPLSRLVRELVRFAKHRS